MCVTSAACTEQLHKSKTKCPSHNGHIASLATGSKVQDSRFLNNLSPKTHSHTHIHTPFTVSHMVRGLMSDTQVWRINMDVLIGPKKKTTHGVVWRDDGMFNLSRPKSCCHVFNLLQICKHAYTHTGLFSRVPFIFNLSVCLCLSLSV